MIRVFVAILLFTPAYCLAQGQARSLAIIAPQAFHAALKPFVEHKDKTRPTFLLSLEAIVKEEQGADDAEKVKRQLYTLWKKNNVAFALLVGDADVFPVRYMVLDRVTPAAFDYSFYPSDLYYADVANAQGQFDNWNQQAEGFHANYYGEVRGEKNKKDPINYDGIHYLPELAVGRWPVSTPAEVETMVRKSLRYEATLGQRPKTASYLVVGGWVDARGRMDSFAQSLSEWSSNKYYYGKTAAEQPNASNALTSFNTGSHLILHSGHGEPTGWDQSLHLKHLSQVKNADKLPIVLSAGCSTAYLATLPPYEGYVDIHGKEQKGTNAGQKFTEPPPAPACYQKGNFNGTSMGEQLLRRSENGAIAYFGCNTGSQPCGLTLLEGLTLGIGQHKAATLGEAWQSAMRYYYFKERLAALKPNNDWYPPSIFFQGMKFMLFSDPSLPLR
jgi:hypothetical protein